jgi:HlyD family secretion protein
MKREDLKALSIDRSKKNRARSSGGSMWKLLSLILFLAVVALSYHSYHLATAEPESLPEVVEAAPAVDPDPDAYPRESEVLIASGYVVAHHKHQLGSKVAGRVEWIGVEKGDIVEKGQLLVKLEDREYRARLEEARAGLRLSETRLEELEAGSRPEEIDRAEAELERSRADLKNAETEKERLSSLLGAGIVHKQEVDNAEARYSMAKASVDAAEKSLRLLELGPRVEQISQARAEVQRAAASVAYAETMLDATEIRAPIAGTVLERIAEIGEMITTSFGGTGGAKSSVVALADLTDLQVELDISQADFNRISDEHECRMTPEAFPDRDYACEIDEISPEADRVKASIQVKVKVLRPDDYLRPEMSARVTFLEKENSDG